MNSEPENTVQQRVKKIKTDSEKANQVQTDSKAISPEISDHEQGEQLFGNLFAVVGYLNDQGYKLSKSLAYKHRDEGKIRPDKEGGYPLNIVLKYARKFLKKQDGSMSPELDSLQQQKLEEEIGKIRAQRKHWEKRNRDFDTELNTAIGQELAVRVRFFRSDIENFFRREAPALVNLVGGDATRIPDLIEFELHQLETWLSRLAAETSEISE